MRLVVFLLLVDCVEVRTQPPDDFRSRSPFFLPNFEYIFIYASELHNVSSRILLSLFLLVFLYFLLFICFICCWCCVLLFGPDYEFRWKKQQTNKLPIHLKNERIKSKNNLNINKYFEKNNTIKTQTSTRMLTSSRSSLSVLTNDDSKILGSNMRSKLKRLDEQVNLQTSKFKTINSTWTPLNNKQSNANVCANLSFVFNMPFLCYWFRILTLFSESRCLPNVSS